MAKSPEQWLKNGERKPRVELPRRSQWRSIGPLRNQCADAAKHRPIGKAMGGCEGLNENGEML
jgi:hypothetical protein